MKKKLKDIMVMIPGKIKKHKKLTAVLLALFVAVGVFSGRLVLTRKAKGEDHIRHRQEGCDMKFTQTVKMAVSSILSTKLCSFLTMLCIIIGVLSVTLLVAIVLSFLGGLTGIILSFLILTVGNAFVDTSLSISPVI